MKKRVIEEPIPLVYRDIYLKKGTGELLIEGDQFTRSVFFLKGNIIFARTNVLQERLGEILFKLDKIDQEQYLNIHKMLENKRDRIGQILIQEGILSHKDLQTGLLYQTRSIAVSLLTITSGEWELIPRLPAIPEDSRFSIGLPGIFVEGLSYLRHVGYYKNLFFDRILRQKEIPQPLKKVIPKEDMDFFDSLGQVGDVPANQLVKRFGLPEAEFWKKLALFYFLDIIDCEKSQISRELDTNIETLLQLFEGMEANALDYYQILNVGGEATLDQIKQSYFAMAKRFHPDRFGDAPDPNIKEKANIVFATVNKAFDTLSDDEKRRTYDARGRKGDSQELKIHENLIEKARVLFLKSRTLYNNKRFWEASSLLEEAVRLDPTKPSYFLLLGLAQAVIPEMRRSAEQNLQQSIKLDPWNAEPYVALGKLFQSEKLNKRAEGFFRKALTIDPEHNIARKKLEELGATTETKKKSIFSVFKKK
jgi:curved DNA-binding protein CbpA